MLKRTLTIALVVMSATTVTGCYRMADMWENTDDYVPYFLQPYKADVHQGNLITSEMVLQLEKGMTDAQVQFLLGVPLVQDQFHSNRWDYVYFLQKGNGDRQLRRLTIFFNDERRVSDWTSDAMPDEKQADQLIMGTIKEFSAKPPVTQ